jgi:N6-L-threonylcarbamoyladenine synthase
VLTATRRLDSTCDQARADVARGFVDAVVDVITAKSMQALDATGLRRLVVSGGVGANEQLRASLVEAARRRDAEVYFPPLNLCTDNGAMIALAGLMRLQRGAPPDPPAFSVRPRWPLTEVGS